MNILFHSKVKASQNSWRILHLDLWIYLFFVVILLLYFKNLWELFSFFSSYSMFNPIFTLFLTFYVSLEITLYLWALYLLHLIEMLTICSTDALLIFEISLHITLLIYKFACHFDSEMGGNTPVTVNPIWLKQPFIIM